MVFRIAIVNKSKGNNKTTAEIDDIGNKKTLENNQ